jgi:carbon storage regulator
MTKEEFLRKRCCMLVLSRKRDESIIIGENIVLTIVDIRGDKVRLGIQAPATVPVHRKEVHDAMKRESERATSETNPTASADVPKVSTTTH